jgi:hypothetical protein
MYRRTFYQIPSVHVKNDFGTMKFCTIFYTAILCIALN